MEERAVEVLKSWKAAGIIFCLIGSFMLVIGAVVGLAAGTAFGSFPGDSQYASQLRGALFIAAALRAVWVEETRFWFFDV
jgi:hypothetical protein